MLTDNIITKPIPVFLTITAILLSIYTITMFIHELQAVLNTKKKNRIKTFLGKEANHIGTNLFFLLIMWLSVCFIWNQMSKCMEICFLFIAAFLSILYSMQFAYILHYQSSINKTPLILAKILLLTGIIIIHYPIKYLTTSIILIMYAIFWCVDVLCKNHIIQKSLLYLVGYGMISHFMQESAIKPLYIMIIIVGILWIGKDIIRIRIWLTNEQSYPYDYLCLPKLLADIILIGNLIRPISSNTMTILTCIFFQVYTVLSIMNKTKYFKVSHR